MDSVLIQFAKCQASGNDFIIIDERQLKRCRIPLPNLVEKICSRKLSIGADGLVLWKRQRRTGYYQARIFNADGSEAESSGNGLRCLAVALLQQAETTERTIYIETMDGIKKLIFVGRQNNHFSFRSNLGQPVFDPALIPFTGPTTADTVTGYTLQAGDREFQVTVLSTGNPHCVIQVPEIEFSVLIRYGPLLETHAVFPARANVEFVKVVNRSTIEIGIWERGVGHTLSSGTGSAAAAVAAILNGWTDTNVFIQMEGGETYVIWSPGRDIIQDGKAQFVYQGYIEAQSIQY